MAIWKEGRYSSWYAELGNGLTLSVSYNPRKLDPDRPYEARVFGYYATRAATREEAQRAAEEIAREALSQALATLDTKDDERDGER